MHHLDCMIVLEVDLLRFEVLPAQGDIAAPLHLCDGNRPGACWDSYARSTWPAMISQLEILNSVSSILELTQPGVCWAYGLQLSVVGTCHHGWVY